MQKSGASLRTGRCNFVGTCPKPCAKPRPDRQPVLTRCCLPGSNLVLRPHTCQAARCRARSQASLPSWLLRRKLQARPEKLKELHYKERAKSTRRVEQV